MANTFIIDGSNRVYAHHHANKLSVGKFEVQAIFGIVKEMQALVSRNPGWSPLMLWDGHAQWRYDIYPEYKAARAAKKVEDDAEAQARRKSREAQAPYIRQALSWMGIHQMSARSQEADDMAGYFAKRIAATGSLVKLISGDTDWSQLVGPNVQWLDPIQDKHFTPVNFFEKTGYRDGFAYIQGKALIGDSSDSIDGVDKIGKVKAAEILAQFKSVEEFHRQVDSGIFVPKLVIHKNLASEAGRARFARNMKLMSLLDVQAPNPADLDIIAPAFSKERFRALCEKLNFQSILRNFDDFVEPLQKRIGESS